MGDFPPKGQTEQDLVATILKVLIQNVLSFGDCSIKQKPGRFSFFENVPTCAAERRPRPHEGRSVLPGDEASDGQCQLQTVRPHRVSHCTLQTEEQNGGPARQESVFVLQGELPAGLEAVVYPDRVPPLLRCTEAIPAAVPARRLREPHDAVPRQADRRPLSQCRAHPSLI